MLKRIFFQVILSGPVRTQPLFPDDIIVVNWCPFEPIRSNIDQMLKESDGVVVENCADVGCFTEIARLWNFLTMGKIRRMAGCSLHQRSRPF